MSDSLDDFPSDRQIPTPIYVPEELDTRSPGQQHLDGFLMFHNCDVAHDYLNAGELPALTSHERAGWNSAAAAKDLAEFDAYRHSRNSFGDMTEY